MPNNTKNLNRKIQRKEKANTRVTVAAVDDESALFGKAVKALGNCRFRVVVPDPKGGLREAEARIGGRSVIRIEINDIVVVVSSGRELEIMGRMDKKNTARLQKENRIHPALLTMSELTAEIMKNPVVDETGFEFDYEGVADEPESETREKIKEKADDEIDIDII